MRFSPYSYMVQCEVVTFLCTFFSIDKRATKKKRKFSKIGSNFIQNLHSIPIKIWNEKGRGCILYEQHGVKNLLNHWKPKIFHLFNTVFWCSLVDHEHMEKLGFISEHIQKFCYSSFSVNLQLRKKGDDSHPI